MASEPRLQENVSRYFCSPFLSLVYDKEILILRTSFNRLEHIFHIIPDSRERKHFLEILKIQVDNTILPWVADGVPIS